MSQSKNEKDNSKSKKLKVELEDNDNWEFDAKALTLEDTVIENDEFEIEIPAESKQKKNSDKSSKDDSTSKARYSAKYTASASRRKDSLNNTKFLITAILLVLMIGICVFLGIRYYTVASMPVTTVAQAEALTQDDWGKAEKLTPANIALTVDGVPVSIGMYNFYYNSVVTDYTSYPDQYGIDLSVDYTQQFTTDDEGKEITWQQKFEDNTVYQIKYVVSIYNKAAEANQQLSPSDVESIQANLDSMISAAKDSGFADVNAYISSTYGDYCSIQTIAKMLYQSYLAQGYYNRMSVETKASNEEFKNYLNLHQDECYAQSFSYLMLEYYPEEYVEQSDLDEETAQAKSEDAVKALAQDYIEQIQQGPTVDNMKDNLIALIPTACADLIEEYVSYYGVSEEEAIQAIEENYSSASLTADDQTFTDEGIEWLFDSNTKAGDCTTVVDSEKMIIYVVLKTSDDAVLVDEPVYSVRHILIAFEDDGETTTDEDGNPVYSEEVELSAKTEADAILNQFNNGDRSEYSFALLAEKHSADPGSTTAGGQGVFGGYYGGVTAGRMVPEFEAWAIDPERVAGDVGIVKTSYGYHIMYFIEYVPTYQYKCEQAVIKDKFDNVFGAIIENAVVKKHNSVMKKTTVAKPMTPQELAQAEADANSQYLDSSYYGDPYDDDSDNMDY